MKFWPTELNTERFEISSLKEYRLGPFDDKNNGFPLQALGDSQVTLIPKRYKNGIRLLNSKISYIRTAVGVFSQRSPPGASQELKESISNARDSIIRNLLFNVNVRDQFLRGVEDSFYGPHCFNPIEGIGLGRRLKVKISDDYTCEYMETWLFCENRIQTHCPAKIEENLSMEKVWRLQDKGAKEYRSP
jgi:hypothetical protein